MTDMPRTPGATDAQAALALMRWFDALPEAERAKIAAYMERRWQFVGVPKP